MTQEQQQQPPGQQQQQQWDAVCKLVADSQALVWLQDAVDTVMQGIQTTAAATRLEWCALPGLLPGMQLVETLQQLEDLIGTKGELLSSW